MILRKWLVVIVSVAIVLIVVGSLIILERPQTIQVTVSSRSSVAHLSGNFVALPYTSNASLSLNATSSSTTMVEKGFPDSYLNLTLDGYLVYLGGVGGYPYDPYSGAVSIWLNLSISGHLAPNLQPSALTVETNASGPPRYQYFYDSVLSNPDWYSYNTSWSGELSFSQYNSASTSVNLLNEQKWTSQTGSAYAFYNFRFWREVQIYMTSYGLTHNFGFSSTLTGIDCSPTVHLDLVTNDTGGEPF